METRNNTFLSGITILDLADEKACFCTKLLADFGARVIKIERPGGDPSRKIGPFLNNNPAQSLSFYYNNINKHGITLDIEKDEGREIFLKLVAKTDGVVETFPTGFLEKLGLGFNDLIQINSKLILVSVTGFGQTGPKKDFKSSDLVASAFGGQMAASGSPSSTPLKPYGEQSYFSASLYAAIAVLLAVRKRNQTGRGEHIDISLQETVASTLEHVMVQYFYEHVVPKRQGSTNWNNAFCILPCKNGFIQLSLFQQWDTLVEWMAGEGMAGDLTEEKWLDEAYRNKNREHIIKVMEQWTRSHTTDELFETGQLMRFPWAPVHSPGQVAHSPHLKDRGFFIDSEESKTGKKIKYPGLPCKFSTVSSGQFKSVPNAGEDNELIYQDELGLTKDVLKTLADKKVI